MIQDAPETTAADGIARITQVAALMASVDALDEELRDRVRALRPYYAGQSRRRDSSIALLVARVLEATRSGDRVTAAGCLSQAEAIAAAKKPAVAPHTVEDTPPTKKRTGYSVLRKGITGRVRGLPGPCVVATDGSMKESRHGAAMFAGWAFLATNGQWDMRGDIWSGYGTRVPASSVAELRGALQALKQVDGDALFLIDSLAVVGLLRAWQSGDMRTAPGTGSILQAEGISVAATTVAARPGLTFEHVRGHTGHILNEGADLLAVKARKWAAVTTSECDKEAIRAEAGEIADAFLRSWATKTTEVR